MDDKDLTHNTRDALYQLAGKSGLLKYECLGCETQIYSVTIVDLVCRPCDRQLVGTDLI